MLISLYEPIPALWDKNNSGYSRSDINGQHLNRIGELLGCEGKKKRASWLRRYDNQHYFILFTGSAAKQQFLLLKRRYARYKQKEKQAGKSGAAASKAPRQFVFADKMKFLDKTFVRRT